MYEIALFVVFLCVLFAVSCFAYQVGYNDASYAPIDDTENEFTHYDRFD